MMMMMMMVEEAHILFTSAPPPDDVAFRCVYRQYGGLIGSRISNWTQAEVCTTIVRGLR